MTKLEDGKAHAESYLAELRDTAEIRSLFSEILVGRNGQLKGAFTDEPFMKDRLDVAVNLKTTDPGALYRGLLVQAVTAFEHSVRLLITAAVEIKASKTKKYSALPEKLRNQHAYHAGQVLTHMKEGHLYGQSFPFDLLLKNLGDCFSDKDSYSLMPEVFTLLMGNATSTRLENLFEKLDLPPPFDPGVGDTSAIKRDRKEARKAEAAKLAKSQLDQLIKRRNTIVHGDLTVTVEPSDFTEAIDFFEAMIEALYEVVSKHLK
jgi:hypothetical protein